jgi:hypothetical protein
MHQKRVAMSIIKMWSFLKHYDGAQPGKRKTASATPAEIVRESSFTSQYIQIYLFS